MPSRNNGVDVTRPNSPELTGAIDRFKQAWSIEQTLKLTDFVAELDPSLRRSALIQLVAIDLESRHQQSPAKGFAKSPNSARLLESYVEAYPELGTTEQLPVGLIGEEYRARHRSGDRPTHDEYRSRFPAHGEQLTNLLERIDAELQLQSFPETTELAATREPLDRGTPIGLGTPIEKTALRVSDHFEFGNKLGEGGMGAVYSAHDRLLGRTVAVKVVRPMWHGNQQMVAQFLSEAQLASRLQHPGICPVYEVGLIVPPDAATPEPSPFIAMKQIEGRTLAEALQACNNDTVSTRGKWLQVLGEVADAVAYAHERGVIHRDLKPANVMLGAHGETQVMDWGLAKFTVGSSEHPVAPSNESEATQYGTVKGTWSFMPPEQATGMTDKIDARADVFALGSMLCQILTGKPAYAGNSSSVIAAARAGDLTDAKTRLQASAADNELIALTLHCLEPERDNRPANAGEFADRIASYEASVERRLRDAEIEAEKERGERIAAGERLRAARWRLGLAAAVVVFITIALATAGLYVQSALANAEAQRQQAARLDNQVETLKDAAVLEPWNDVAWSRYVENRRFAFSAHREAERRAGWLASLPVIAARTGNLKAAANEAQQNLSQAEKDRDLCLALREAGVQGRGVKDGRFDTLKQLFDYRRALQDYGVDISNSNAAAATIKVSLVRDELVGVFDELLQFANVLDRLDDFPNVGDIVDMLKDVDPDPTRMRMRTAIVHAQTATNLAARAEVETLADEWDVTAHPVKTSLVFCEVLAIFDRSLAIRSLHRLTERDPRMFEAHNALGLAYLMLEPPDRTAALAHMQAAAVLAPKSPGACLNLANLLEDFERYDEAKALYQRAVDLQPDYSEAHINLASLAQKLKSYGEAEDSFRKGLELRNDDSVANRGLGETLVELGRFSEAEACFRRAIEIDPDYSRPYHGLAMLLEGQQRYDEAEACYRTAIKLTDPGETPTAFPGTAMILPNDQAGVNRSNAAARQDLGRMFLRLRRFEEAEPLIRRAIELAPKMSEAHHSLGDVLSASARPDEAEACYRKAILLDPDSAAIYVNLGGLLVGQQRLADAESCFRSALKIQPDLSQAHLGLGNVLFFRGLHDEAIECLQTAVENQPNLIEALSTLGGMLASQQRWDEAESYLRQAIEQRPKFASAHLNLTVVLQRQGRLEDATAILQAALEELPDNAKLHCRLGRLFRMQGRFKEAVASLQRGHELGSNQAGWNVPSGQWLAEAQRDLVLDERLQEVVEGDTVPVDAEEMVSLAQLCQQPSKKLYRKAVALYEQAFESEPELAELRPNQPHRYNAACAAALAAAGAGIDASELGSEWQNNRRTQARQWLEADLTAWKALKDEPQSQTAAEQALSHWLSDPDLGSVREQTELAKLPEDERGKWESLWRDVRVAIGELRP